MKQLGPEARAARERPPLRVIIMVSMPGFKARFQGAVGEMSDPIDSQIFTNPNKLRGRFSKEIGVAKIRFQLTFVD